MIDDFVKVFWDMQTSAHGGHTTYANRSLRLYFEDDDTGALTPRKTPALMMPCCCSMPRLPLFASATDLRTSKSGEPKRRMYGVSESPSLGDRPGLLARRRECGAELLRLSTGVPRAIFGTGPLVRGKRCGGMMATSGSGTGRGSRLRGGGCSKPLIA